VSLHVGYYGLSLFVGAFIAAVVAVIASRRAVTPIGRALGTLMAAVFVWALAAAFEASVAAMTTKIMLSKIEYIGIATTPILMFLFALRFAHPGSRLPRGILAALWAVPAATLLLAVTNEAHHFIWSKFTPTEGIRPGLLIYGHGPFFWVHAGYSYLILAVTTALLLLAFFRYRGIHRKQALLLLLAFPLPWAGNALYLSGLAGGTRGYDFTPVGFALAGLFLLWAMFRLQLVDIIPIARERVIESMGESLLILDEDGRLSATNPAARRLIEELGGPAASVSDSKLLGRPAAELFEAAPEMAAGLREPTASEREIAIATDGSTRFFDLRMTPLQGQGAFVTGWVAVLYDITRVKKAETAAVEARKVAETLREAGLTLSSKLDFQQVSALILDLLKRVIPFDIGAFLVLEGTEMRLAAIIRPSDGVNLIGETFPVTGSRLCHTAVQRKQPLISPIKGPEDILLPLRPDQGIHSFLGVPVVFREQVTGLIALYNFSSRSFTDDDARIAELFASQVAIATDNSRRVEQMEHQAVTDQLTGLYNRRAFAQMGEREVGRARRYQRPLALILVDLDHFKDVNDTYGHLVGDHVLRILTERVTKTTRATDIVCRYGGEEFLVLMPEAGRDEALSMAERLREEVSRMTVVTEGSTLSLTISLGVASFEPTSEEDIETLISRADRAMYQAKAAGRNTVRG
jgi:diguanylate cyclase (GGDEF)-like protein/PAS domain S-box-containing protein